MSRNDSIQSYVGEYEVGNLVFAIRFPDETDRDEFHKLSLEISKKMMALKSENADPETFRLKLVSDITPMIHKSNILAVKACTVDKSDEEVESIVNTAKGIKSFAKFVAACVSMISGKKVDDDNPLAS